MKIQRATPVNEFLAKLIFLLLPTAAVVYYLLESLNVKYAILQNATFLQTCYFAAAMGLSALFYSFRFRFLPTFVLLLIILYSVYTGLNNYPGGEFDTFFLSVRFWVFSTLFASGWFIGWGYIRLRYFSVVMSVGLLAVCISAIANARVDSVRALMMAFVPAVLHAVYNIFTSEQIYNYKDKSKKFWWYLVRRLLLFTLLCGLILITVMLLMYGRMKETVAQYGGGGKKGEKNNMLKENKDGTFDLNDYTKLSNSLNRDKELLFCAHINNYFKDAYGHDDTRNPNPLYLTAFYYTKFDTATETFERDKVIPYNDLFEPDPSKIPLFSTVMDTMVVHNSLGDMARDVVEVEVYNCKLSPKTYLAPNVGYFVQPITVERDFREKFVSAYRTKSYVSLLNSAYFVYNIDTPVIRKFQEDRFRLLREVKGYTGVDTTFIKYYTYMPGNDKFRSIGALAHKITDTAHTPVDKVIAIRNYFLSRNENGEHLYKYTDNPGEPDIPNASKLLYFLNENHKGYCAYYAGATLFMLRSLGIPSRIAVGFLTEDRSDKNKGWYWYYANQAHAWVQVYFPGYGWLDFDTTVGNTDENRPPSQPDGTPPMQPPKAWLAEEGVVENVDTLKKTLKMSVKQFVFHDKEYKLKTPVSVTMDMKVAAIFKDSLTIPLPQVKPGDEGTAVSYAEALKKMEARNDESAPALINRIPAPQPIDEVYLKKKDAEKQKEKEAAAQENKQISGRTLLIIACSVILGLIALTLLSPELILLYYINRYKNSRADKNKAYWAYRASAYYLHMAGFYRGLRTPMQYARQIVDPLLGTSYVSFMNIYLKRKYAKQELNERECKYVDEFLSPFLKTIRSKTTAQTRIFGFMNPVRMAGFFTMPEDDEKEA